MGEEVGRQLHWWLIQFSIDEQFPPHLQELIIDTLLSGQLEIRPFSSMHDFLNVSALTNRPQLLFEVMRRRQNWEHVVFLNNQVRGQSFFDFDAHFGINNQLASLAEKWLPQSRAKHLIYIRIRTPSFEQNSFVELIRQIGLVAFDRYLDAHFMEIGEKISPKLMMMHRGVLTINGELYDLLSERFAFELGYWANKFVSETLGYPPLMLYKHITPSTLQRTAHLYAVDRHMIELDAVLNLIDVPLRTLLPGLYLDDVPTLLMTEP